jgi:tRNA (cytidine/uridine-2'-O-)-methyltransferase
MGSQQRWLFTSKSDHSFWDAKYTPGDWLILGNETHGITDSVRSRYPSQTLRIPQVEGERCLNLATAAGIAAYHAIHHVISHSARSSAARAGEITALTARALKAT